MTVEKPILDVLSPIANGGELFREDLRVMGGVATAAAINPAAEIDTKARTVSLSRADFRETNIRENGSLRDLDALVLREKSDPEFTKWKQEISRRLGADLVANIFGLRTANEWEKETASPVSALMLRAGDRYQTADGETMKLLSPWVAGVPAASLEPWQYVFRGFDDTPEIAFQGLNPANDLVNRLTRTTILRPRDLAKISSVLDLVENNPQLSAWLADGDGASQAELARIALSVRANSWHSLSPQNPEKRREMDALAERLTGLFGSTLSPDELANHQAFLFRDAPDRIKHFLVGEAAAVKSPIYWLIETGLLDLYQKLNMENWPLIRNFT